MKQMHFDIFEFLKGIDSDYHEIPAKTLAARIKLFVLRPIDEALIILEKIEQISPEDVPPEILVKWNQKIAQAMFFGGENVVI